MRFKNRSDIHRSFNKIRLFNDLKAMWDFGGGEETQTVTQEPKFYQQPDYAESTQARQNWSSTLSDWGKSGTYGVNLPNYNDVYKNAAKKVNQYYWGSASNPGLMDKISAGAARRGVQDSPAGDVLKQRSGVEEANQLMGLSSDLDVTKANAIETARGNWMNSMQSLASLRPGGSWGGTTTTTQQGESAWPALIGAGVGLAGNLAMGNYLGAANSGKNMISSMAGFGSTTPSSIAGNTFKSSRGFDWGMNANDTFGIDVFDPSGWGG
jgi:hypothetical protein